MEERFEFTSDSDRLIGRLFRPKGKPLAAIVTTGPLTSVKEQASGAYAKALAERGFAALAFDHRYFGESGGMPRQFENPNAKIADIRAAVAALKEHGATSDLPIAAVGVCVGAGYMARAVAEEPGFIGLAGVAGYYAHSTPESRRAGQERIDRGRAAERSWRETGITETIPAVAAEGDDVAMPLREAFEYYGTPRGAVANYLNAFAVQSLAYTTAFDAFGAASVIKVPTLMLHSENALAPPLAREFFAALQAPHEEMWITSTGQIDFYDDPTIISQATDRIERFFAAVLRRSH
jgi:fermentation-respiration switch protein FrsA (DUF1100 family)